MTALTTIIQKRTEIGRFTDLPVCPRCVSDDMHTTDTTSLKRQTMSNTRLFTKNLLLCITSVRFIKATASVLNTQHASEINIEKRPVHMVDV